MTEESKPSWKVVCRWCGAKTVVKRAKDPGEAYKCGRCTITRSIRLKLIKPLSETWDDIGPQLRALRMISHRLTNAAVMEAWTAHEYDREAELTQAVRQELEDIYTEHGERAVLLRAKLATAEAILAKPRIAAAKRAETETKASGLRLSLSSAETLENVEPPSELTDMARQRGLQKVNKYLKNKHSERVPSERYPSPIFLRDGSWDITVGNAGASIHIRLRGGKTGRVEFAIAPFTGPHWDLIRKCAAHDPKVKMGDCKIVYKKERRGAKKRVWMAIVTVTTPRPERAKGEGALIVHRGARQLLYGIATTGWHRCLMGGAKLRSTKERLSARRRGMQKARKDAGGCVHGRGKRRKFEAAAALDKTEANVVRTACQQAAAAAVKRALEQGCGTIVREEYGGIKEQQEKARYMVQFPYYQLGAAIDWAAEKAGLEVVLVPSEYISTTCPCPGCRHSDDRSHQQHRGIFKCMACGYTRPADFVAAINMARRAGVNMAEWDKTFAAIEKMTARSKNAKKAA